jgi:hypothetical protein
MATVMRHGNGLPAENAEEALAGKVILVALLAWIVIGPLVGILYEFQVDTHDWYQPGAAPAVPLEDIQAAYFSQALYNFFSGAVVWLLGVIALTIVYARHWMHSGEK